MAGTRCKGISCAALLLCAILAGCVMPPNRSAQEGGATLATAAARVELAIDAANQCVGDYTRTYDSPTITPGDLLDAALTECEPYFAAHRGALHALAVLQLGRYHRRQSDLLAEQQAEHYSNRFRHIVRDTGLAVLVQRRSATPSLASHRDEGDLRT